MRRSSSRALAVCAIVLTGIGAAGRLGAVPVAETPQVRQFTVQRVEPNDALPILGTMTGERSLAVIDAHTVQVRGTATTLRLAEKIVGVLEAPSDEAEDVSTYEVGDDSILATVRLRHASLKDAMAALRVKARVARFAVLEDRSLLLMRDSRERVDAALVLLRGLEAGQR